MSWELKIWNANRSQLLNTITEQTAGGLSGGFKWQRRGNGDCVQLDLSVINSRTKLAPRAVVQLMVDGVPQFYGIVPDSPSSASPTIETAQVLGGREALRRTLMDSTVYRKAGIWAIARDLFGRLLPPSLMGLDFPSGDGPVLDLYYAPTRPLSDVLDDLAKSAGVTGGVDELGRVFLGRPATMTYVDYAGRGWRRLRVQGREAVTRAVLRIISAPAASNLEPTYTYPSGVPATMVTAAQLPEHATYRAEAAFEVPEGVSVIGPRPAALVTTSGTVTNPGAVSDDDPATFAEIQPDTQGSLLKLRAGAGWRTVGVELDYTLPQHDNLRENTFLLSYASGSAGTAYAYLPPTAEDRKTVRLLFPAGPDNGRGVASEAWLGFSRVPPVGLRLHRARLLVIDEDAAQRLAESYLQAPYASPAEITLDGLRLPMARVRVVGGPEGEVGGDVQLWEYEHTPENPRTTRIRLGSDGQSDTARAIKWAVKHG